VQARKMMKSMSQSFFGRQLSKLKAPSDISPVKSQ